MTAPRPYRVTNPATGELVEEFSFATDEEVKHALTAAYRRSAGWGLSPVAERCAIVRRVGELFVEQAAQLGQTAQLEMGKRSAAGAGEARFCGAICSYYADNGRRLLADTELADGDANIRIERLPIGVVLGVMPWNYPYYQVARFAIPNLVAGNTVLVKHAESCPRSALAIARIMKDAGVPDGAYINLFATHDQVGELIGDPRVRGVSLTGSDRAGAAVAAAAGRNLKKVVLELGGSDPYIVLDTDNVPAAAESAWTTRMDNMGQACNSNKRMIVMGDIYDDFVRALVARAAAMRPVTEGDESGYAPMASREAALALAKQLRDAVEKGATLHVGGELLDERAAFFAPAVLTGVTPAMRAYHEELFGPVAVVYRVADDDEAVELANAVDYGLGGAVFSSNEERATAVARRLEVGMANVNIAAGAGVELPFGGVKRSGFGRELGPLGIEEFVNKRLFYVQR